MLALLHSITNQKLFEKHPCNPCIPHQRKEMGTSHYCLKNKVFITFHCQLCSTCYTAVRIKNCLKSTSAIKVVTMKNTDDFCYEGKPSCATTESTLFAVSKDEWDIKKDTSKSMKNALYVLAVCQKGTSRAEAMSNSEKIKPAALELHLSEGISQSVSYSVSRKFCLIYICIYLKLCSNLLKAFRVNLKTCLGLVLPSQYRLIVIREN